MSFVCSKCGKKFESETARWQCDCGEPLNLTGYAFNFATARVGRGIWRWLRDLPVVGNSANTANIVTIGEGETPLVYREMKTPEGQSASAWFKLDFINPTGSYKDRGMSALVSWLKSVGITQVIEDSSGNAGSSMAAYCAAGNIACDIYVPDYTSEGKCVQIQAYGANLVRVPGTREDTTHAAIAAATVKPESESSSASSKFYASHNWNPYFLHGIKTWLFEVIEQLQPRDCVLNLVVPVGQGSIALGAKLALDDLERTVYLNHLKLRVKIWAVQSENCAPLARAADLGLTEPLTIKKLDTAAEGIASSEPVRGTQVLAAVRATHEPSAPTTPTEQTEDSHHTTVSRETGFVTVSEAEIWSALDKLCRTGIYVEPTSAAATAGWLKLLQTGRIRRDTDARELTVVYLSGSGLKATDKLLKHRTSD